MGSGKRQSRNVEARSYLVSRQRSSAVAGPVRYV